MTRCAILLPSKTGHTTDAEYRKAAGAAYCVLDQLGYEVDQLAVPSTTGGTESWLTDGAVPYEFYVIANVDTTVSVTTNEVWERIGKRTQAYIPTFVLANYMSASTWFGVDCSTRSTAAYRKGTHAGSGKGIYYYGSSFTDPGSGVTAIVTEVLPTAGKLMAWKLTGANGAPYYVDASHNTTYYGLLPLLLQEAINDGVITAPTKKKQLLLNWDDAGANNTLAEVSALTSFLTANGYKCVTGVQGEFLTKASYANSRATILANQAPTGPFIIIDHQVTGETNFFEWDMTDASGAITAADARTRHEAVWDAFVAGGVTTVSSDDYSCGGFRFFDLNKINNVGMDILANYGLKFARLEPAAVSGSFSLPANGNWPADVIESGVRCCAYIGAVSSTYDVEEDSADDLQYRSIAMQNFMVKAFFHKRTCMYFHNTDLYDGHDSGTGNGWSTLQNNLNVTTWMSDIFEFIDDGISWRAN